MDEAKQIAMRELRECLTRKPASGDELVLGCRAIIGLWIGADLPYPHDLLDPIVGIESQTDHLLGGERWPVLGVPRQFELEKDVEEQELHEVYAFFAKHYQASTAALLRYLQPIGQAT